jgi:hypothetical protein
MKRQEMVANEQWVVGSEESVPPCTPAILYEYQKKRVVEIAIRK